MADVRAAGRRRRQAVDLIRDHIVREAEHIARGGVPSPRAAAMLIDLSDMLAQLPVAEWAAAREDEWASVDLARGVLNALRCHDPATAAGVLRIIAANLQPDANPQTRM